MSYGATSGYGDEEEEEEVVEDVDDEDEDESNSSYGIFDRLAGASTELNEELVFMLFLFGFCFAESIWREREAMLSIVESVSWSRKKEKG